MSSSVSSSTSTSSTLRTYGLSGSGIDVDSMVKQLMTAAKQPYTKLEQKQTVVSWKKEAYNNMYTSINSFRNDKVFNFSLKSTLAAKTATSSNTSVASITASGDAVNVNHSLNVTQLASGVTQSSTAKITTGSSKTSLAEQFGTSGTFMATINGKSFSVNSSQSINDVVSNINKLSAGVTATYDTTQDRFFLYTNSTGASASIDFTGSSTSALSFFSDTLKISGFSNVDTTGMTSASDTGVTDVNAAFSTAFTNFSGSFSLNLSNGTNSTSITVSDTDTMQTFLNKINNAKDSNGNSIGAVATFANGKFTVKSSSSSAPLALSSTDAAATSFLNNRLKLTKQVGVDAAFKLDNVSMTQSTNKFAIAGVTYNLTGTGQSNVAITNDTDSIIKSVKNFISDYNTMLSTINTKISEEYDSDYLPLTDDQKSSMTDSDISIWTEKAKTGLLQRDSTLTTLVNSMRTAFTSAVSGVAGNYKTASSLGISTGVDYLEKGKLYVDETKLRAALEADPDAVYKVFGTTGADSSVNATDNGIAVRLSAILKTASSGIVTEAGTTSSTTSDTTSALGKQAKEYRTKLTALSKKLTTLENQYYSKFNAMESALSKLSQQTNYLSSLLSSN